MSLKLFSKLLNTQMIQKNLILHQTIFQFPGATKKGGGKSKDGLPPNMRFSRAASYNNPHEMFPSASKLFAGMNAAAGGVTKSSGKTSRASSMSVVNEAEDGESSELLKKSNSLFLQPPSAPPSVQIQNFDSEP